MKKLTVLCTALAASVLCATPISLHWSPKDNAFSGGRQRRCSRRTAAHANECGRCEQKDA